MAASPDAATGAWPIEALQEFTRELSAGLVPMEDAGDDGGGADAWQPAAAPRKAGAAGAPPKRKRGGAAAAAAPARRRATALAAADAPSSGEEDDAAAAALDGGEGVASARAAARRALIEDMRETCAIFCLAIERSQQAWASDHVAATAAAAVLPSRAEVAAARAPRAPKPKAEKAAPAAAAAAAASWRVAERDALRRALALFGLGRPAKAAEAISATPLRHSLADIEARAASRQRRGSPHARALARMARCARYAARVAGKPLRCH
jgi:hypothetical protein